VWLHLLGSGSLYVQTLSGSINFPIQSTVAGLTVRSSFSRALFCFVVRALFEEGSYSRLVDFLRRGLVFEARRLFLSLNSRPRVTKKRRRTDSVTLRRVDHQLDAHRAPLTATDSLRSHPARDSPLPHPRVDRDLPECASPPGCAILYGKSFNSKKSSNEVYYTA